MTPSLARLRALARRFRTPPTLRPRGCGASDYRVHRLVDAHSMVALDPRVDRLLIPDPEIAALLDEELVVQYVDVEGGSLAIAWLPAPSTLLFTRDDDAGTRISCGFQSVASVDR